MLFFLNVLVPLSLIAFIIICVIKDKDVIVTNFALCVIAVITTFVFNLIALGSVHSLRTYTPKLFILTTLVVEFGALIFYFIDEDRKKKLGGYWFIGPFLAIIMSFGIRSIVGIFNCNIGGRNNSIR